MAKPWILVQARMGSTRLPGKVLLPVLGKPLIVWQLERLQQVQGAQGLAVLTPNSPQEAPLIQVVEAMGVPVFCGDEANVLDRYTQGARHFGAKTVMRVCSDAPLIDPKLLDDFIAFFEAGGFDYAHNDNSTGRRLPLGLGAEIFTREALEIAWQEATEPDALEHVTPYLYWHPQRFRLGTMDYGFNHSHHRWTVDTREDFDLVSKLLTALQPLHPMFGLNDILEVLSRHPDWESLNAHVIQKTVSH